MFRLQVFVMQFYLTVVGLFGYGLFLLGKLC